MADGLRGIGALRLNQALGARSVRRLAGDPAPAGDAALALGGRARAELRRLGQSVRDANDGIALTQTLGAALGETADTLDRLRAVAAKAADPKRGADERRALQSQAERLRAGLDRIAERTTFAGRHVLDGSTGPADVPLDGDRVTVPALDARAASLGRAAVATGAPVAASRSGALTLNGVAIGAGRTAIAVARAVNEASDRTGVTASVNATQVRGDTVGGGRLDALTINGVTLAGVEVKAGDEGDALRDAINAVSDRTGVTATRDGGRLTLTAADGRDVDLRLSRADAAVTGLSAGTTAGTVTLSSDRAFTIGGRSPRDAGFAAGPVAPDRGLADLDLTTPAGATKALDAIDRARARVRATRDHLDQLHERFRTVLQDVAPQSPPDPLAFARSLVDSLQAAPAPSILAQAHVQPATALQLLGG
jgi:flagellin